MKFLFFLVTFLISLSAIERPKFEDFAAGYERNKASMLNYEGMPAFALSENLLAVLKQPNVKLNKYVKYDPFLNLYLVRTDFSLIPTPMGDEEKLTRNDWIGIWDPNRAYIGHIKYLAQNIDEKDQLDFSTKVGLLGTPCCEMMGIALNNSSFIGNRYLKHFMKYNDVYWGDIGVDFAVRENKIYVNNVRKSGQFLINDEIISVDGTLVKDIRKLNEKILFADRGSTLYFQVLRDNVDLNISTEVFAKDLSKFNLPSNKPKPKPTN
ncbi:PDZ domain-containing protein, partial [Campylobacter coli]|nr:PDZ domain-containing protein [Campylobacter coli]